MKSKQLIRTFPFGYRCLRNHNGSILLLLQTKSATGYVFVKKVPQNHRMPPINQNEIDLLQLEWRDTNTIVDWFSDDACRYFITMTTKENLNHYDLTLHAFFGNDTFEVKGFFSENKGEKHRERVYNERYLKQVSPDTLITKLDFTNERYDIIFPDDPLSHCRRLGEVIAMNAICPPDALSQQLGKTNSHNDKSLENNNESDLK